MSSYGLRRGRASDARAVRRILSSVLSEHGLKVVDLRADVEIARYADVDPSKDRFVAVFEGKVIGFAIVVPINGGGGASDTSGAAGELSHVFVERAHRRHGVGTLLIARAVDAAKARGHVSLHLSTMEAFVAACSYYERHGWIREKEARGSIFFKLPLAAPPPVAQEPAPLLPPIPWTLHGVLSLLSRFARVRERLERDLAPKRAASRGGSARSG